MIKELITQRVKLAEVSGWDTLAAELAASPSFPERKAEDVELIRKFYASDEKLPQEGLSEGQIRHIISTAALDRDLEIMLPKGADFKYYRKNPVVLWSHSYHEPGNIIGRNAGLEKTSRTVKGVTQFNMKDEDAARIFQLYKDRFLSAWSVGFVSTDGIRPEEKDLQGLVDKDILDELPKGDVRYLHQKWSMLEYSSVAVPANPEALTEAVAKSYGLTEQLIEQLGIVAEDLDLEEDLDKKFFDMGDLEVAEDGEPEEGSEEKTAETPEPEGDEKELSSEVKAGLINYVVDLSPPEEWLSWAGQKESSVTMSSSGNVTLKYGDHDWVFKWDDNKTTGGNYVPAWPGTAEPNDYVLPWEDNTGTMPWKTVVTPVPDNTEVLKELKELKDEMAALKAGRVLSAKNRALIGKAVEAMGAAQEALQGLLKATEPEPEAGDGDDAEKGFDIEGLLEEHDIDLNALLEGIEKTVDIDKRVSDILSK